MNQIIQRVFEFDPTYREVYKSVISDINVQKVAELLSDADIKWLKWEGNEMICDKGTVYLWDENEYEEYIIKCLEEADEYMLADKANLDPTDIRNLQSMGGETMYKVLERLIGVDEIQDVINSVRNMYYIEITEDDEVLVIIDH